ncbi:MAG: NUDIX hydrolase [Ruminococcus sp.]|nr:NUDIX hydrolase [Ruminococcus sp.]
MKIKVYNYGRLKEKDITDRVIRVKALIINSKEEILLGEAFNILQFPGGHLEENETLKDALIREISEEVGLILHDDYEPYFAIKYYLRDFPVIGNNRSIEIYYYYIFTDKKYNRKHAFLDDQERTGDFTLKYVPLKEFKKYLEENKKEEISYIINREMLLALKYLKKVRRK